MTQFGQWGEPADVVNRLTLADDEDVAAVEAVPPLAHLPGATIGAVLRHTAARYPDRAAVIQLAAADDADPVVIDFATYRRLAEQAANLFRTAAGERAPVVAVVAPYLSEALVAMLGGGIAGRYLPINPFLELNHVAGIMAAARADLLVVATDAVGPGVWDRLADLQAQVPTLARIWRIAGDGGPDDFMAAVAAQPDALTFAPATDPTTECAYLHTGGTTATPKLVRHTHGGQLLQGWLCGTAMGSGEGAVIGHAMPNFHVGGAVAMMIRGIVFGQSLVTLTAQGFRDPGIVPAFWDIVGRFGMTSITTAPTTAAAIMAAGGDGPATLTHFTTGGGPLSPALAKAFEARYGLPLREVWGGTEFHGILSFHYGGDVPPRLGSCGRVVPYHRVVSAVLDGNRFVRLAAADERGILIACGPTTVPGYVDPANDAHFFVEGGPDGEHWATTGDVGRVDEDGFVWIFGREKDVIIRGGHNIDSATIDDVLASHPAVLYAAAVGQPCASKGELPMAYVQLRPGASASAAELLDHARVHTAERAGIPVEIVVIDAMPMTAVGKVSKPPLRLEAIRLVAGRVAAPIASVAIGVEDLAGRATVTLTTSDPDATEALAAAFADFAFTTHIVAD